ncbi:MULTISPECIES: head fiber protein [Serratia]|uniref:Head fiber protein n=2 Tax=Serratia nevei TaxID=2703794 RepID=A0ABT7GL53_9GAMM|nr:MULTISPECIES: head fiber protein [Serratia]MDK4796604.1 head fiber protein [Serratia nevei]MDK4856842.1 head fiber protein [Serratia nevei]MDK5062857.1 head fiber protein [Serratia nevei]MDK5111406.1 head fiber protein [Serratia nevei]MDK5174268.1 head fiber protein [Serratia nevei]
MPKRVVGASGVPVEVATMDDVSGEAYVLPAATTSAIGGVKKMPAQADSTATDVAGLLADFNALLAKARTAGLM